MVPPLITLEEHFISSHVPGAVEHYKRFSDSIAAKLADLVDGRIQDMEVGDVSFQIVSHAPMNLSADECSKANDELAQACQKYPDRFAGFAVLPMLEPKKAADELERTVKQLGFVGALVNNHVNGTFYDEEKYWPTFARAVELDVPIYLHPSFPSDEMAEHYKGNYSDKTAFMLSIASWGWHTETGLHILRLFASGLFDKYPKLKIIIGHNGEMLPFALDRIITFSTQWGPRERDLRTVWNENIWITTAGYFSLAPLACVLRECKIDRIMYSVDYPFALNDKGLAFVKDLAGSDLVNDEQLEMICHKNAEKLLKLRPR
ncbi:hypothetical protein LTR62_003922 [Meristemomyces frigidus]|uniref:Amidohydrolase-related domain-containing protein n=1 Tax=Meristemomyces frigidus TaxID=1508187 RepID=A0AAN7YRH8_9PEZI|nr:hypothetical protein LTR62_003922 [Meristemomyces frigidus]